jgi:hypothetical protein
MKKFLYFLGQILAFTGIGIIIGLGIVCWTAFLYLLFLNEYYIAFPLCVGFTLLVVGTFVAWFADEVL